MRKIIILFLLPAFLITFTDSASQINGNLVVNFLVQGFGSAGTPYVLNKNQTYYFAPLSQNVCTFNAYTWFFTRTDGVAASGITINGEANNFSFGNGGIGVDRPPIKFSLPGTYNVRLKVTRAVKPQAGEICSQQNGEEYKQGYIYVPYDLPIAAFNSNGSQSNKTVQAGTTVTFAALTGATYNYPNSFVWRTSLNNSIYQDKTISLQFNELGTYTVTLTSYNPAGSSSPKTYTVSVTPKAPATDFLANGSASGIRVVQNTIVSLNDISLYQPASWLWTISGSPVYSSNTSNTSQNPKVSFGQIGPVNVSLSATNTGGSVAKTKNSFITVIPQSPSVVTPVTYCAGATSIPLTTTNGAGLKWYTSATGGTGSTTAPRPPTAVAGLFYYYVTQTVSGYESPRQTIAVQVNPLPAKPATIASIVHCTGSVVPALTANGTNLKWYTNASGGTSSATAIVPGTSAAGVTNYYVTQTDANSCESFRAAIVVNVINTLPLPSAISPVNYCLNGESFPLLASPTLGSDIKWYNTLSGGTAMAASPTPITTTTGTVSYFATQIHPGCAEGPRAQVQVITNNIPTPDSPGVVTPVIYNQGQDAALLVATGTNLKWYTTATKGAASNFSPLPLTGIIGTSNYYVTQTVSGCESRRAQIEIVTKPGVPVPPPLWSSVFKLPTAQATHRPTFIGTHIAAENGETYIANAFYGTVNFGLDINGNPVNLNATGLSDFYLAKYNNAGRVVWIKRAGGPGSDNFAEGISLVKTGSDIFIVGRFYGSVTFGTTTLVSNQTFSPFIDDIFIVRYDTSGALIWAKKAGGSLSDVGYGISISNAGIFIAGEIGIGELGNDAKFDNLTPPPDQRIFIAKYDFSGNAVWVSATSNKQFDYGRAIGTDVAGNSIITTEGAVFRYDNNGLLVWKKLLTGYDPKLKVSYSATGNEILTDQDGNIFIAGRFTGSINFDADHRLTSSGYTDAFLVKLDSTGKVIWARKGGGIFEDDAVSLNIDDYGNIYLTGTFTHIAYFGGQQLIGNNRYRNIFITKYGSQGNEIWVKKVENPNPISARAIKVDQQGILYLEGSGSNVTFDNIEPVFSGGNFLATIGGNITSPGILSLQPASAFPGEKINIVGKGLLNTTSVFFNSIVSEEFKVNTSSNVETRVPQDATTGKVKITTPAGSDSASFSIKAYNDDDFPTPIWPWAGLTGKTILNATTQVVADARGYTFLLEANLLSKYDSSGRVIWKSNLQGSSFFAPQKIALDTEGKVVFSGNVTGGPNSTFNIGNKTLTGPGYCIARYDTSGNVLWVVKTSGAGTLTGNGMTLDRSDNIIIGGTFSGNVDFSGIQFNTSQFTDSKFIAKYNSKGEILWAINEGFPGNPDGGTPVYSWAKGSATDGSNNVILTEKYSPPNTAHIKGLMLFKYAANNNKLWEKQIGKCEDFFDRYNLSVVKLVTDKEGNLFVVGNYNGDVEIGGKIMESNDDAYFQQVFAAKFDKDGNTVWVRRVFNSISQSSFWSGNDDVRDLQLDSMGNVYMSGMFYGTVAFGNKTLTTARNDGWITKFDAFGNRIWAMKMESASGAESRPQSIFAYGNDKLAVSGNIFNGQVFFTDTSLTSESNVSTSFVAHLLPPAPPPSIVNFFPKQGANGDTVEIDGSKFLGAFEVRFNGTVTTDFSVSNSKKIMARVPENAATGTIVVTTPNGTAKATAEFLITGKDNGFIQLCPGSTAIISSNLQGSNCQWQVDMGSGFVNISDTSQYSDFTTTSLKVKNALSNMYGFQYRCIVNGSTSNTTSLKFVSYWAGSSNDDWDEGGNWGCANRIPDVNTDVYIPSGTVIIRSNVLVRSLKVSPAAKIIIEPGYTLDVLKGEVN